MATIPVSVEENFGVGDEPGKGKFVRVIVADTQAPAAQADRAEEVDSRRN